MPVTVVCLKESAPDERRVAITPETAKKLAALGATVRVAEDAGANAGFPDAAFESAGGADAATALAEADLLLCVQSPDAATLAKLKPGAIVVGMLAAHAPGDRETALKARNATAFAMEKLPRTTRAQAMDVLSSQAGMAGYKAVLLGAQLAPRFFPMLSTAAGTIRPSLNLASSGAVHASEMYARNLLNFVSLFLKDGAIALDWSDELIDKTCWVRAEATAAA